MRFVLPVSIALIAFSGQAFAQQPAAGSEAPKAPSQQSGANSETDATSPKAAPSTGYNAGSEKQKAPSVKAGTNVQQSTDPTRGPVESTPHGESHGHTTSSGSSSK